jgi:release factor glutamine methyltransferase
MDQHILDYEPDVALYVPDDDPLVFYKAIARKAKGKFLRGGFIYFEINEEFGQQICTLLADEGYKKIEQFSDIHNRPRIVRAVYV